MRSEVEGMEISRNYTPVPNSLDDETNLVDKDDCKLYFLIKTYADGALTPKLKELDIG